MITKRTAVIAAIPVFALGVLASTAATGFASTPPTKVASTAVTSPPAVISAHGPGVFPHSIDYQRRTRSFLVGSLKHSTISRVGIDGTVQTVVDDHDLVAVQAVRDDPRRGRILASNVDYGVAERSTKAGTFHVAGVASYEAATGHRQWYTDLAAVAADGKQHLISDVAVAPDGTAYAVDELTPTVFRIDTQGHASVLVRNDLLAGALNIPNFLNGIGVSAVEWLPGNVLILAKGDGTLIRLPIHHPSRISVVHLNTPLATITADLRLLPDHSLAVVSSGLLSGKPAVVQRVRPNCRWTAATVTVTGSVPDPVTSGVTAGPGGATYALSGGLADLFAGKPTNGFTLRSVRVN